MVQKHDDEFNLFELFQILWNKKFTLFLISFISFLFGIYSVTNTPIIIKVTTPIKYGNESSFIKYMAINEVLKESNSLFIENEIYMVNAKKIFENLVNEFQDYEEMTISLRKSKFVNELIKDLKKDDQERKLISLAKSFTISEIKENKWELSFTWHNDMEGRNLFNDALLLTLENIKRKLIDDVNLFAKLLSDKNDRIILSLKDQFDLVEQSLKLQIKKRVQYLIEQSNIAKKMEVKSNLLIPNSNVLSSGGKILKDLKDVLNYDDDFFSNYDNNYNNFPYYLRGYKAIEKEIEIIKSRSKEEQILMSSGYINLKNKLLLLEKNRSSIQLKKIADNIKEDNPLKWVKFNFDLADTTSQNKSIMPLIVSLIFGLILGSIYILIYSSIIKNKNLLKTS